MNEKGYTLVELLVVMVILSIVVAGLTTVFVTGSNAEAQLNNRFQAQLQARTAIDKLRLDIHCASAAQAQTVNTYPSVKLAVGNCYSATPTISWCVVQVLASPPRYQLYRTTGTTNICQSSDASRLLVAVDREAQTLWGIGSKSALKAHVALDLVKSKSAAK